MKVFDALLGRVDTTAIAVVVLLAATVLAAVVAWRREDMRPIAYALGAMALATFTGAILWSVVTPPRLGDPPLEGWRRVAGHVEHAAYILPRAAAPAAAWRCCIGRSGWPVWVVGAVLLAGLVVTYPAVRGTSLATYYLAAQIVFLVLAHRAVLPWIARQFRTQDVASMPAVAIALIVAGDTTAAMLGAHRRGFWGAWQLSQLAAVLSLGSVVLLLAWYLARGGREPWRSTSQG